MERRLLLSFVVLLALVGVRYADKSLCFDITPQLIPGSVNATYPQGRYWNASGLTGRGFNLGVGFIDHTNPMWNFSSQPRFHVMFNTTDDMMTMTHYWGWMGGCVPYYLTDPDGIPISCFKQWPTGQVNDTTDINANDFQLNTTLFSAKYPWYTYSTYWWYQTIYEETSVTRYPFGGPYSANYDVFVVTVAGLGYTSMTDEGIIYTLWTSPYWGVSTPYPGFETNSSLANWGVYLQLITYNRVYSQYVWAGENNGNNLFTNCRLQTLPPSSGLIIDPPPPTPVPVAAPVPVAPVPVPIAPVPVPVAVPVDPPVTPVPVAVPVASPPPPTPVPVPVTVAPVPVFVPVDPPVSPPPTPVPVAPVPVPVAPVPVPVAPVPVPVPVAPVPVPVAPVPVPVAPVPVPVAPVPVSAAPVPVDPPVAAPVPVNAPVDPPTAIACSTTATAATECRFFPGWHGPDCGCELRPVLDCVEPLGGGQYAAKWGYKSWCREHARRPTHIHQAVGWANRFLGAAANQGQPTDFCLDQAEYKNLFSTIVTYDGHDVDGAHTWVLGHRVARVTNGFLHSKVCSAGGKNTNHQGGHDHRSITEENYDSQNELLSEYLEHKSLSRDSFAALDNVVSQPVPDSILNAASAATSSLDQSGSIATLITYGATQIFTGTTSCSTFDITVTVPVVTCFNVSLDGQASPVFQGCTVPLVDAPTTSLAAHVVLPSEDFNVPYSVSIQTSLPGAYTLQTTYACSKSNVGQPAAASALVVPIVFVFLAALLVALL